MKYGVSETTRLFDVDRDTIKKWAYIFSDYLSVEANPEKGTPRQFAINDIRAFAYILQYWEDDPDIEYVKSGLNSNSQFEDDSIDNLITSITPLFGAMPEDIDETWRGVVFGGEFELGDIFSTATHSKRLGVFQPTLCC